MPEPVISLKKIPPRHFRWIVSVSNKSHQTSSIGKYRPPMVSEFSRFFQGYIQTSLPMNLQVQARCTRYAICEFENDSATREFSEGTTWSKEAKTARESLFHYKIPLQIKLASKQIIVELPTQGLNPHYCQWAIQDANCTQNPGERRRFWW